MSLPIHVVAAHPDNERIFQALATPSEDIRAARTAIHTGCTKCLRNAGDEPGLQLRRSAKCKSVYYCSKECQTTHWPIHKPHCSNVDGSGIGRLVQNLWSNPLLMTHIQACLILHFDLLDRPQLDKPFMARIDLGIEPANTAQFFDIFIGKPIPTDKIPGMLQVNAFTPLPPTAMADLTPKRMDIWRQARAAADKTGFRGDSVGLLEFGNGENVQTITLPVHIQHRAMDLVRVSDPWVMTSAITGIQTEVPFNTESCMEFMNIHIRSDKQDQLLLRTKMRPSDIQIIQDAAVGSQTSPAHILRLKMAREAIFRPLMVGPGGAGYVPLV
ncbi:hypothetical protein C8R46DRAFT_1353380 [Mycena filopes]|nr:hypothetical protein C8R46DRAFT_1353380 [Mycena filopes]